MRGPTGINLIPLSLKLRDATGAEVGFVTSGLCSASIGRNIALASVKAGPFRAD